MVRRNKYKEEEQEEPINLEERERIESVEGKIAEVPKKILKE